MISSIDTFYSFTSLHYHFLQLVGLKRSHNFHHHLIFNLLNSAVHSLRGLTSSLEHCGQMGSSFKGLITHESLSTFIISETSLSFKSISENFVYNVLQCNFPLSANENPRCPNFGKFRALNFVLINLFSKSRNCNSHFLSYD